MVEQRYFKLLQVLNSEIIAESILILQCCIPSPEDTESRMEAIALGQVISVFLRQQPETARNVFLRRYWYMDSIQDISRRFGMGQSKVKSMLFRTRNALRAHLEQEGYTL